MAGFIDNPRQAPRAPVRCDGRLALIEGGFWSSPTSDYGPRGCQIIAPLPLAPGMRIFVELANARTGAVELSGRVAWMARAAPWRMGVAFDPASVPAATGFFDRLAAAYPGVDTYGRAPDRIPEDAPLAPAPPPDVEPLLSAEEAQLLAELGAGLRADALRARLGASFAGCSRHAMFSLLGRRYLVVGPPDPDAAERWTRIRSGARAAPDAG